MKRSKLLFLCQTLPFPPDGGVSIRTYNVLRQLAKQHEIYLLCFYRKRTTKDVKSSVQSLREFCATVDVFEIPQEHSPLRFAIDHVRSLAGRVVYTRHAYRSDAAMARLKELLSENEFPIVHLDSLDLSAYLPCLGDRKVACTHHNIESRLLSRRARLTSNQIASWYLMQQSKLMEAEEKKFAGKVDMNLVCSHEDANQLRQICPEAKVCVVPNGVDANEYKPSGLFGGRVVFLGGTSWYPNKDALAFFETEISSHLRKNGWEEPVLWVGRASDSDKAMTSPSSVEFTGYLDDVRPLVGAASCFIVPLRIGGGTRLKILTAWSLGLPVVSTTVGCEGLAAADGQNILIRDDPEQFANAILEVLRDGELARRLGQQARKTVETAYDWEIIGTELREVYRHI